MKRKQTTMKIWKHREYYLMLLPAVAYVLLFCYAPMYGLQIAFKNYKVSLGVSGSLWIGFRNFTDFFQSYYFVTLLKNTLVLSPSQGVVNTIIEMLGGERTYFMADPKYFRHLYVWSGVWQGMGWGAIIYLAALSGVDPVLHEAAAVGLFNNVVNVILVLLANWISKKISKTSLF